MSFFRANEVLNLLEEDLDEDSDVSLIDDEEEDEENDEIEIEQNQSQCLNQNASNLINDANKINDDFYPAIDHNFDTGIGSYENYLLQSSSSRIVIEKINRAESFLESGMVRSNTFDKGPVETNCNETETNLTYTPLNSSSKTSNHKYFVY